MMFKLNCFSEQKLIILEKCFEITSMGLALISVGRGIDIGCEMALISDGIWVLI
jgi:hypothetical protein